MVHVAAALHALPSWDIFIIISYKLNNFLAIMSHTIFSQQLGSREYHLVVDSEMSEESKNILVDYDDAGSGLIVIVAEFCFTWDTLQMRVQ